MSGLSLVLSMLMVPLALVALVAQSASALVLPPEDIVLTQIHVQFEWPSVGGASSYDLQVVVDMGAPDPFDGVTPVVDVNVGATEPRAVVTNGLSFFAAYAWRVRDVTGSPGAWGATHRFQVAAIPPELPTFSTTSFACCTQPGITLVNVRKQFGTLLNGYIVAITDAGELVWYLPAHTGVADVRLLPNGRLLYNGGGDAYEATLNGQVAWTSPQDEEQVIHHEVFPMPSGDVLALTRTERDIELMGETKLWQGDGLIILDRDTNDVLWSWDTFDHLSTLDYDAESYANSGNTFDWTHANAAVYNPDDGDIYVSLRHLSRIVRIDYPSGNIVYHMGFDMPSGDPDFGDNLFSFQHSPQLLSNGNMMVYDNGNRRDHIVHNNSTGVTKAIELQFTGNPPTAASIVWEWTQPTYSNAVGDADRLANGNTLVTAGIVGAVHEVDAAGVEVWRLEGTPVGSGTFRFYRAERIDSLIVDVPGDVDGDGHADIADNCPDHFNPGQADSNADGFGDICSVALGIPSGSGGGGANPIPALPAWGLVMLASLLFGAGASGALRRS